MDLEKILQSIDCIDNNIKEEEQEEEQKEEIENNSVEKTNRPKHLPPIPTKSKEKCVDNSTKNIDFPSPIRLIQFVVFFLVKKCNFFLFRSYGKATLEPPGRILNVSLPGESHDLTLYM